MYVITHSAAPSAYFQYDSLPLDSIASTIKNNYNSNKFNTRLHQIDQVPIIIKIYLVSVLVDIQTKPISNHLTTFFL